MFIHIRTHTHVNRYKYTHIYTHTCIHVLTITVLRGQMEPFQMPKKKMEPLSFVISLREYHEDYLLESIWASARVAHEHDEKELVASFAICIYAMYICTYI